ncbi:MAG: hypothetical protein ACR2ND_06075 [Solirubrobacteraceae bacterium]
MDDRDHHDTNVVSLRRRDDLRRRDQVARRIFAEQDEIGTFSQGNLVPPTPLPPDTGEESGQAADPFFEEHVQQPSGPAEPVSDAQVGSEADHYFAQLAEQSASEMANQLRRREQTPSIAMPGSASLSVDAVKDQRHGQRLGLPQRAPDERLASAVASRSVVLGTLTALLATAALALVIVLLGNQPAAVPRSGAEPPLASILSVDRNPFKLDVGASSNGARARAGSRYVSRPQRTKAAVRVRVRRAIRVVRARPSGTQASASSTSGTPSSASQSAGASGSGSTTSSPVSGSRAPSGTPTQTRSSPSGQAASSSDQPAFGLNGSLGPGHSPIG